MQQFDASGFDDDVEDVAAQAKAADAGGGFSRHPRGKFQGRIDKIVQKEHQGRPIWEVYVETAEGTAQYAIFGWKPGEVAQAKAKAQSGYPEDLDKVQKGIARHKRLFVDLGLAEPDSWAKGENSILGRLGELIDRPCTVVVQADRRDPSKDQTFINAPARLGTADGLVDPTAGPGLDAPDFGAGMAPEQELPF